MTQQIVLIDGPRKGPGPAIAMDACLEEGQPVTVPDDITFTTALPTQHLHIYVGTGHRNCARHHSTVSLAELVYLGLHEHLRRHCLETPEPPDHE